MDNLGHSEALGLAKHQLDARRHVVEAAKELPLPDAVWKVIFYNNYGHRWGGQPFPNLISFEELGRFWADDTLTPAVSRALALYNDAYRIGDLHHRAKFEKKACHKATADFMKVHPGYSERTYHEVINHGCFLAR